MTGPVRALTLSIAQPARRSWVGFSLSVLCFIHCAGAAALVPLLPAAFSFLTDSELVEWSLLAFSAILATRSGWSQQAISRPWRAARVGAWTAATGSGIAGLVLESEALLQTALAALALLQLWSLVGGRRKCPHDKPVLRRE